MQTSYLAYAMSVIVSRALPDARDGLKPVHRRILYAMREGGYDSSKPYKKSARIVGDVMGKYHPHGDSAIYDAMVRMAQDFSMRLPLVDGQGNFGSMDGDPAAAMRYTEARLNKVAETLLEDIDKETVDFQPNYDESTLEPTVLPARFPNLLVNGANGIAVGMATNIPPHNLGEVIDGCCAYIDNPEVTIDELIELIPGPDFPTGGQILGRNGSLGMFHTGRGSIMMRSKTTIEEFKKDRLAIIVHEIPYQVNKARLIERIADCVREKTIEGISDLRDESDRDGVRIVIELKKEAIPDVVLNQLYRYTPLQTSFGANMLALNYGRPMMMNLKEFIAAFVNFREEVITKRTIYELGKARDRAHVLAGLAVAVANIDEIIAIIRGASDPADARDKLTARHWPAEDVAPLIKLIDDPMYPVANDNTYKMSETQAKAILDLRLHRLTALERDKIGGELKEVCAYIAECLRILGDREALMALLRGEIVEIKEKYATPRRTELVPMEFETDIEDLIQKEDMVVTVSHTGYVKRVPLSTYRAQKRGGKGRTGMQTKDEDFVTDLFIANTHTPVLFFTTKGIVHKMKVYKLPLSTPQARGKAFINLLPLEQGETISVVMPLPEDEETWDDLDVIFGTSHGTVRRNSLSDFKNIRANGLIAMKLDGDEKLIDVRTCTDQDDILLSTRKGKAIRFPVADLRVFKSRASTGIRGIKLMEGDDVVSISVIRHVEASADERAAYLKRAAQLRSQADDEENGADTTDADDNEETTGDVTLTEERFTELEAQEDFLLAVTTKGFGKRTSAYEYRTTGRGGSGIWNMKLGKKNGQIVCSFKVLDSDEVMLVTDGGQIIRMPVGDVRFVGRQTQGVTLFRIEDDEQVVSAAVIRDVDDDEDGAGEGAGEATKTVEAPEPEEEVKPESDAEDGEE
ncbi:MAG: DNA gyrase subunit A [Alphaproteobacteria bacterium]|nr:DNA gyrase subunit A [Alphaproteobacteria bacterium]